MGPRKQWIVFFVVLVAVFFGTRLGFCDISKKCADTTNIDFGPGVQFTSAALVPAGGGLPEHCLVKGAFLPEEDPFVVKLPTDWNGNYFQVGNGGLAGSIDDASVNFGLVRGYASGSASGGYDVSNPINTNGQFGYNPPDNSNPYAEEKLDGYCFSSVHKTNVLAKQIIKIYYGKRTHYSYYKGCSTGGRQGMIEAQRYPADFDGIMAGAPLVYLTKVTMRDVWQAQHVVGLPVDGPANTMMAKVSAAVYKKCDSIDGLVDGMIDDPRQCTFNALSDLPVCPGDVPDPQFNCFTTAQRAAIQKIYDGPRNSAGELLFKGTPVGGEAAGPTFFGPNSGWLWWILPPFPGMLSLGGSMGGGFTQYCSLPPDRGGPGWDYMTFSWDDDWPYVMEKMSARCDANDPDLWGFKKRGGKLIQYHGWGDPLVSPFAMAEYYEEVLDVMGDRATDDFYKLYMIPGLNHCALGLGCANDVGMFDALVNWVEKRVEPGVIVGARAAYPPTGMSARTRPLCPYPGVARYLGVGSIDDAANFTCVKTIEAHVRIEPETLSLASRGTFTAFVTLPHQGDWRIASAVCEGAPAVKLTRHGHNYKATFNKQDLKGITVSDAMTFTVTLFAEQQGHHYGHGAKDEIAFEGSDTVRIVE
jgi:feruloyl esterase